MTCWISALRSPMCRRTSSSARAGVRIASANRGRASATPVTGTSMLTCVASCVTPAPMTAPVFSRVSVKDAPGCDRVPSSRAWAVMLAMPSLAAGSEVRGTSIAIVALVTYWPGRSNTQTVRPLSRRCSVAGGNDQAGCRPRRGRRGEVITPPSCGRTERLGGPGRAIGVWRVRPRLSSRP